MKCLSISLTALVSRPNARATDNYRGGKLVSGGAGAGWPILDVTELDGVQNLTSVLWKTALASLAVGEVYCVDIVIHCSDNSTHH